MRAELGDTGGEASRAAAVAGQEAHVTVGEVAERLGVGVARVRQLDVELHPERCACGARRYTAAAVEAYEVKRERDRGALSQARRERMLSLRATRGL